MKQLPDLVKFVFTIKEIFSTYRAPKLVCKHGRVYHKTILLYNGFVVNADLAQVRKAVKPMISFREERCDRTRTHTGPRGSGPHNIIELLERQKRGPELAGRCLSGPEGRNRKILCCYF
jgi:hypothetical protein